MTRSLDSVKFEMQDGDLVLSRGKSLVSWFIRVWTTSPYSHVAVVVNKVESGILRPHVVEARWGTKVSLRPLDEVIRDDGPVDWFSLVSPEVDRKLIVEKAMSFIGYDYAPVLQFLRSFAVLTKWIFDALGVPDDIAPGSTHCAEAALKAIKHGGCDIESALDPARMTPGDASLSKCYKRMETVTL